ncbi:hypothetical protein [Cereibacter sphaeroides]|uniref:hypothetical protein n=1 Tax=Cereibacter sphaeroides TaxID=1063 RepID=UPI001F1B579C|nr:hypothetical protein [Cereibacter sphaeroides]MCE6951076.1 hypothetical protein [Cereibacter sphaeroides]MCE6969014.1 hypothetical protein [Cereibacter sphaeroides]
MPSVSSTPRDASMARTAAAEARLEEQTAIATGLAEMREAMRELRQARAEALRRELPAEVANPNRDKTDV